MTRKVISAPTTRQAARKSIGVVLLPVLSRIQGIAFWAMKPPRLPTELIAASPAAAEAPVRKAEGMAQSTGCGAKIPTAAPQRKTKRSVLSGT